MQSKQHSMEQVKMNKTKKRKQTYETETNLKHTHIVFLIIVHGKSFVCIWIPLSKHGKLEIGPSSLRHLASRLDPGIEMSQAKQNYELRELKNRNVARPQC